jgi:hypothetical protein
VGFHLELALAVVMRLCLIESLRDFLESLEHRLVELIDREHLAGCGMLSLGLWESGECQVNRIIDHHAHESVTVAVFDISSSAI